MIKQRFNIIRHYPLMYALIFAFILLAGAGLAVLVHRDYQSNQQANLDSYTTSSTTSLLLTEDLIEDTFDAIYYDLRSVARQLKLGGIDPQADAAPSDLSAHRIEKHTQQNIQEIYVGLVASAMVSEIDIVPVNFDPDAATSDADYHREPLATFDQLIQKPAGEGPTPRTEDAQEIKVQAYRLIRRQLAWFRKNYPHETTVTNLNNYPIIFGPEVVTRDNSRYSLSNPDDKDRSGLVISVPFYGPDGGLQGCVSAVILTHALRDLLPDDSYAIVCPDYDYFIHLCQDGQVCASKNYAAAAEPDPGLLFSKMTDLKTKDMSGDWFVWAGQPDAAFWNRYDVKRAIVARNINYGYTSFIVLIAVTGCWLILRGKQSIARAYRSLEGEVKARTLQLADAADAYDRQKSAIDQHALVFSVDIQGVITEANGMLCRTSGYSEEEILGQHRKMLENREMTEAMRHQIWGALAKGEIWQGELQQRDKNGCHYWVLNTTVPMKDDTGQVTNFITVQTDISEYKKIQSRLLRDATQTRESA